MPVTLSTRGGAPLPTLAVSGRAQPQSQQIHPSGQCGGRSCRRPHWL